MAKNIYKASFYDKLPFGGIGTGHIDLGSDGSISGDFLSLFAIKAEKDNELFDARILQSTKNELISLPCFEKASSSSFFPFAEVSLSEPNFPATVKMTAFSPFIPLNDTDSGIPAVMLEFEVANNSDERFDYSICGVMQNVNSNAFNRMGCTDSGEAYVFLSGNEECARNTCIATDGKNVSFCEYIPSISDFTDNFIKEATLTNKTRLVCENSDVFGALCTHFSLSGGETHKVSFCISWYNPENDFSRNYYAQYFESSLECASYLFRQKERLYRSSMDFCENVSASTLPEHILEEINKDLFVFSSKNYIRLDEGTLLSGGKHGFSDFESFLYRCDVMTTVFPSTAYSETEHFYKESLYDTASDEEIILSVLSSYRKYVLTGDVDTLIEDWYYIAKCMEKLFGENLDEKCKADENLICAVFEASSVMAEAVKDKKRFESYSSKLCNLPIGQFSMDISEGFAKINEMTGFEYDANKKHIGFDPKSDICPLDVGNTFRCFFCTPQGFGYVEEGIDYIEINLSKGSLGIRSFGVPRTPRLVQYGGRNWRFTDTDKCALLDSELEITPQKKLTIFIDIKQ